MNVQIPYASSTSFLSLDHPAHERLWALAPFLTPSVVLNLTLGAYHFMAGLLLGLVKYYQISQSPNAVAHPYISVSHRASLLYGFASVQMATMALLSSFPEAVNVWSSVAAQVFFVAAVVGYAAHGILRDTSNQLKKPHVVGHKGHAIPAWAVQTFMFSLVLAEVGGCGVLMAGMVQTFWDQFSQNHFGN